MANNNNADFGRKFEILNKKIQNHIDTTGNVHKLSLSDLDEIGGNYFEYRDIVDRVHKKEPYLYSVSFESLDYDFAKKYYEKYDSYQSNYKLAACSGVSKGHFFGRNFDWHYDDLAEFIVRTAAANGKFATLGIASTVGLKNKLTQETVDHRHVFEEYKMIPFFLLDGINEKGLFCSINVVPRQKENGRYTTPTKELRETIPSLMMPRYILDNYSDPLSACRDIKEHISIYTPDALWQNSDYELHYIVGNTDKTYVLEVINSVINILSFDSADIDEPDVIVLPTTVKAMTNFYLSGVNFNADNTVWTPEANPAGRSENYGLTSHASGLERWNLIAEKYNQLSSLADMEELMGSDLRYTKTYEYNPETKEKELIIPFWYSELCGKDAFGNDYTLNRFADLQTTEYGRAQLQAIKDKVFNKCAEEHAEGRKTGHTTWFSKHSCVYDLDELKLYIIEGENEQTGRALGEWPTEAITFEDEDKNASVKFVKAQVKQERDEREASILQETEARVEKDAELSERIDNLESLGRYLSTWNVETGLPGTNPPYLPYSYSRGDYYIVSDVTDDLLSVYKPHGTAYTGTEEDKEITTEEVKNGDFYLYDGTGNWTLLKNAQRATNWGEIQGTLAQQTDLQNALNNKQNTITDLADIREGAELGATAVQPSDLVWEKGTGVNSIQSKGTNCVAQGDYSVAEGHTSKTVKDPTIELSGQSAHAEGEQTTAQGFASHAEGGRTFAIADHSHAEGYNTTTDGADSHAEGNNTVTNNWAEHAEGRYNVSHKHSNNNNDPLNTQSSIGIGTAPGTVEFENNKNAVEVMQNGDVYIIGIGDYEGKDLDDVETLQEVVNNKSTVTISDTGTATEEAKYITVDGVEKKLAGGLPPFTEEDENKVLTLNYSETPVTEVLPNIEYTLTSLSKEELNSIIGDHAEGIGLLSADGTSLQFTAMTIPDLDTPIIRYTYFDGTDWKNFLYISEYIDVMGIGPGWVSNDTGEQVENPKITIPADVQLINLDALNDLAVFLKGNTEIKAGWKEVKALPNGGNNNDVLRKVITEENRKGTIITEGTLNHLYVNPDTDFKAIVDKLKELIGSTDITFFDYYNGSQDSTVKLLDFGMIVGLEEGQLYLIGDTNGNFGKGGVVINQTDADIEITGLIIPVGYSIANFGTGEIVSITSITDLLNDSESYNISFSSTGSGQFNILFTEMFSMNDEFVITPGEEKAEWSPVRELPEDGKNGQVLKYRKTTNPDEEGHIPDSTEYIQSMYLNPEGFKKYFNSLERDQYDCINLLYVESASGDGSFSEFISSDFREMDSYGYPGLYLPGRSGFVSSWAYNSNDYDLDIDNPDWDPITLKAKTLYLIKPVAFDSNHWEFIEFDPTIDLITYWENLMKESTGQEYTDARDYVITELYQDSDILSHLYSFNKPFTPIEHAEWKDDLSEKSNISEAMEVMTEAPSMDNPKGLKFVILEEEIPEEDMKDGYFYIFKN